jgi:hypothetical protein
MGTDDPPSDRGDEWDGETVSRDERSGPPTIADRYTALDFEQEGIVIYDRENTAAWIQSDTAMRAVDSNEEDESDGEIDG